MIKPSSQIRNLRWLLNAMGLLALVLAVGGVYLLAVSPIWQQYVADQLAIDHLQLKLASATKVHTAHEQLESDLDSLRSSVQATRQRLPLGVQEESFLQQVRKAARANQVEIANHRLGSMDQGESFSEAKITLDCIGSFASMVKFLNSVDQFTRITDVSRFEIEAGKNTSRYTFQVTFVLYFMRDSHDRSYEGG